MKTVIPVIAILCLAITSYAQQTHFSQYFSNPLELNPALTGYYEGGIRLSSVHRRQWAQDGNPFITVAASAETRLLKESAKGKLGIGMMFNSDRSNNDVYSINSGGFSVAYNIPIDQDERIELGIGLQGQFSQKKINPLKLSFESQFTGNGFDPTITTPELLKTASISYLSLNSGILLNFKTNDFDQFYLGCGLYNVNTPKTSFLDSGYKTSVRYNGLAGGNFQLSETFGLQLSSLFSFHQQASEVVFGAVGTFHLGGDKSFSLGSWYRTGDAFIPYIGLGWNGFELGVSNDISINTIKSISNYKNSLEVSFRYCPFDNSERKKAIPWY